MQTATTTLFILHVSISALHCRGLRNIKDYYVHAAVFCLSVQEGKWSIFTRVADPDPVFFSDPDFPLKVLKRIWSEQPKPDPEIMQMCGQVGDVSGQPHVGSKHDQCTKNMRTNN